MCHRARHRCLRRVDNDAFSIIIATLQPQQKAFYNNNNNIHGGRFAWKSPGSGGLFTVSIMQTLVVVVYLLCRWTKEPSFEKK